MAFFFFVVGLEARREFDMGELRERRRIALPVLAGLGGMAVPVADLPRVQRGRLDARTAGAWRCRPTRPSRSACSRSSAPRCPDRLRVFLLTVVVVDDVVALLVIAIVYTDHVAARARSPSALAIFAVVLALRALGRPARRRLRRRSASASWVALLKSGVDPVIVGLAMGLLTYAYPAARVDLERATELFRVVPRAADAGAGALGAARRRSRDLAERAPAAAAATRGRAT